VPTCHRPSCSSFILCAPLWHTTLIGTCPHDRSDESLNEHEVVFGIDEEHGELPRSSGVGRPSREQTAIAAAAALLAGAAYRGRSYGIRPVLPQQEASRVAASSSQEGNASVGELIQEEGGSHQVPAVVTSFNFRGSEGAEAVDDGPNDQSATDLLNFFGCEGRPKQPEAGKGG
jgi:hypothetical protein